MINVWNGNKTGQILHQLYYLIHLHHPISLTQQENIGPQVVGTRQTTHTGPSIEETPPQESSEFVNLDYMNSEVDLTATQPSNNLITIYEGRASDLNQFVIIKPKH